MKTLITETAFGTNRRSGKTTRLVDAAIQAFFDNEYKLDIVTDLQSSDIGAPVVLCERAHDCRRISTLIEKRLEVEHDGQYRFEVLNYGLGFKIRLKK